MLHQHRTSKRPVAFTIALVLATVSAVCAQYGYDEPTYYYPSVGGYGDVEPTNYYPSYGASEPVYYYPSPPSSPVAPVAPAPYYYATPVAPTTPYGSPAPVYYYTTPVAPTTPYGSPEPVYYYAAPTPVAPTTPYGGPEPTYYYTAPAAYGAPEPVFYYSSPAPTTPYGPAPTPFYYTAPVAPTTPYGAPTTTYYYVAPVAPAPYGYAAPAPYYYYAAPVAPTTPYGGPVAPSSFSAPVPSTCPPCPECSGSTTTTPATSYMSIAGAAASEGTCYCPYDADWKTWAIGDTTCRSTLYSKCQSDSRLSCSWLDSYFSPNSTHADDFTRENEGKIQAYLYNDCPPSPPCTCAGLEFSTKDTPAATFQCCNALKIYAKVPYSALGATDVNAYCEAASPKAAARVSGWVKAQLWHTDCSVASTSVYTYKKDAGTTEAAPATATAASTAASTTTPRAVSSSSSSDVKKPTILAAVFGALGGAALAVAAAAGWVAYRKSHPRYSMV